MWAGLAPTEVENKIVTASGRVGQRGFPLDRHCSTVYHQLKMPGAGSTAVVMAAVQSGFSDVRLGHFQSLAETGYLIPQTDMEIAMQESEQTPNWQPITFLPSIAEVVDGMLESAQNVHASLQQARTQPHVMDDYTIGRVHEVHGQQLNDLWLYEEQLSRWQQDSPSARQRQEIERLTDQLTTLRKVLTSCVGLADEMKDHTIENILAKDDVELALEFLMGKHNR